MYITIEIMVHEVPLPVCPSNSAAQQAKKLTTLKQECPLCIGAYDIGKRIGVLTIKKNSFKIVHSLED